MLKTIFLTILRAFCMPPPVTSHLFKDSEMAFQWPASRPTKRRNLNLSCPQDPRVLLRPPC